MTTVRFLLKSSLNLNLPHCYLEDLPYALSLSDWRIITVPLLKAGDLLFARREKTGRVTHLALAVEMDRIFHCTWKRGPTIDLLEDFLHDYPYSKAPLELIADRNHRIYNRYRTD